MNGAVYDIELTEMELSVARNLLSLAKINVGLDETDAEAYAAARALLMKLRKAVARVEAA